MLDNLVSWLEHEACKKCHDFTPSDRSHLILNTYQINYDDLTWKNDNRKCIFHTFSEQICRWYWTILHLLYNFVLSFNEVRNVISQQLNNSGLIILKLETGSTYLYIFLNTFVSEIEPLFSNYCATIYWGWKFNITAA